MGGTCNKQVNQQRTVTYLHNSIPNQNKYKAIDTQSIRFGEVTAYKYQSCKYMFAMTMRYQITIRQCIPVLNQLVDCIACQNYQLTFQSKMLIDVFDNKFSSTLFNVKNQKTMGQFSMKIIPFTTYSSIQFKRAFYQLQLNSKFGQKSLSTVKLIDKFIYGINPGQQALVLLFQRCLTNLANVAQYRRQANMPWTAKQKIKLVHQIFQSYEALDKLGIAHRDLRPSNIYLVASTGRFAIGNLSRSRLVRREVVPRQSDLMSVCGVPDFSCKQMKDLMLLGQHIGKYSTTSQDYAGLKSILNIIQTCENYDKNPNFKDKQLHQIADMLTKQQKFQLIMNRINSMIAQQKINKYGEIGDRHIAQTCSFLLAHTHKNQIESYMFQAYGCLGYHRNYSDKAHKMLQKNNEIGKEVENAPILRSLGQFYQTQGAQGTQYFYNAFVLFILRADNEIRYGYPDKAEDQLTNAREIYFKFNRTIQSQLPRIQINRVSALIQNERNNISEAIKTINQTLLKAGQNNIPVDKQCKILLAYGKIYSRLPQSENQAIKKLTTGVSICDNVGAFQTPSSCRIFKSKFLRQIGSIYSNIYARSIDPRAPHKPQQLVEQKALAQSHLKSALQIQQRQVVDDLQIASTLQQLGRLYYMQQKFFDSKKFYDPASIRYGHIKQLINPLKQLQVIYARASCCYYLKEYNEARKDYQACLMMLETLPKTDQNIIFYKNIQGNLGLSLMQLGNSQGINKVQTALKQLKERKGQKSYDYFIISQNYKKLLGP